MDTKLNGIHEDLNSWRARLDHLRVQGNLGKMELEDKWDDFEERFEPAYARTKERLSELAHGGAGEARTLARSLQAGWDELRRTYRELSRESHHAAKAHKPEH